MAKIKWVTTPKAAYEWVEVVGGETMSDAQRAALLDEYVEENGLVPVESTFVGETPVHKYGRYKAVSATASALPPALPGREGDLVKANAELATLRAQLARAEAQLGKQQSGKGGAEVIDGDQTETRGTATGGAQTTEDARAAFNEQLDMETKGKNAQLDIAGELVGSSEEVRENPASNDKSDDNPVVGRRGKKAD